MGEKLKHLKFLNISEIKDFIFTFKKATYPILTVNAQFKHKSNDNNFRI